ncbi:MAG: uracil-DNA glycosylase [Nitrospiria bacterium]
MKEPHKHLQEEYLSILRSVEDHLRYARETGVEGMPAYPVPPPVRSEETGCKTLEEVRNWLGECHRCKLHSTRTQIVFGSGNPQPELVFVGEGPGEEEDLQGKPFVGRAGQLLTKMIEAMGLTREDVYIANIVKCRPPKNRNPEADEISSCSPFLTAQLSVLKPKVICTLGTFASKFLLKTEEKISKLRGRFHLVQGVKVMPTYHPAYLLRNPSEKKVVWEDLQIMMQELNLKVRKGTEK